MEARLVVRAALEGPLSLADVEDLLNWMQPLCGVAREVVLDMRGVERMDGAGIRALLLLQEEFAATRGELRLTISPGSRLHRLLCRLHLDARFHLEEGERAVAAATQPSSWRRSA